MNLSPLGRFVSLLLLISFAVIMAVLVQSEPSRGNLDITLIARDTKEPLVGAKLIIYSSLDYRRLVATTDKHGRGRFIRMLPDDYTIDFDMQAGYDAPMEKVTVEPGTEKSYTFTLKPTQPNLTIGSPNECFLPDKKLQLRISGVTAKPKGEMVLFQLQGYLLNQYLKQGQRMSNVLTEAAKGSDPSSSPSLKEIRRSKLILHQRRGSGTVNQRLPIDALAAGVYLVVAKTPDARSAFMLTVTRLGLVMKHARNSLAVYCVDLQNGKPLPGVGIEVLNNGSTPPPHLRPIEGTSRSEFVTPQDVPVVASSQSDDNGLFSIKLPESSEPRRFTITAIYNDQVAVCTPDSNMDAPRGDPTLRGNVVFDRPVYRPGQRVYYKMYARQVADGHGRSPSTQPVTVRISDPNDMEIWSGTKSLSDWGTLSGNFVLPEWSQAGSYTVEARMRGGSFSRPIAVSEYRKPEMTVALIPQTERAIQGQPLTVKAQVRSFFGTPVAGAEVNLSYSVERQGFYGFDRDSSLYPSGNDGMSQTLTTDASGDAVFKISTDISSFFPSGTAPKADYEMSLNANVTQGNQVEFATCSVILAQGEFDLHVESDRLFCARNEPIAIEISAQTPGGKQVQALAGQAEIILNELTNDGQSQPKLLDTVKWTLGTHGKAHINIPTNKPGDIQLRVTTRDTKDHLITSEQWLFVLSGDDSYYGEPVTLLEVMLDKQKYLPGDTARVLVKAASSCKYVMTTVEGREVSDPRVIELHNGVGSFTLPVTAEMMPGVVIGAVTVDQQQLMQSSQNLVIDRKEQTMQVTITPKKPVMAPGEMASVMLQTKDSQGRPVPAELCIGAVDEAIYSISEDDTTPMEQVLFPEVYSEVSTTSSFDTYYYSGDSKSDPNRLRQRFRDTAYWNPAVMTDEKGEATVSFRLPDNLTTWRLTARALAYDALSGQGIGRIEVTKSLITRLDAPRFMVQGDTARLMAVVQNNCKAAIKANLRVNITGAASLSKETQLSIKAGEVGMLPVELLAERFGELRMEISATAGTQHDGVLTTLEVIPRAVSEVQGFNLGQGSADQVTLKPPSGAILPEHALTLRVSPSLAGSLTGGMEFLKHYPYGCVEQTTSSFLPALVSRDLQQKMGIPEDPELKRIGMMGVTRLASQTSDYTWGWWEYGSKDPWMTAYALFGLMEAYNAGWHFSRQNPTEWGDGLAQLTNEKGYDARETLVAYVLARTSAHNDRARELLDKLPSLKKPLPDASQWAIASLAYLQLGDREKAQQAFDAANKALRRGSTDWSGSRVEELGCMLWAGSELGLPVSKMRPLLDQLATARKGEGWYSTRDTAFALIGLSRYMTTYEELSGEREAAIQLNGKQLFQKSFGQQDLFRPEVVFQPEPLRLVNGALKLQVQRKGSVHISGSLKYLNTQMQPESIPGLSITRSIKPVQGRVLSGGALKQGQVYRVTIRLAASRTFRNLMVQCPVPAGLEPIDRGKINSWEWDNWWDTQVTGEREVAMAVRWLDKGTREMSFVLKASTSGHFNALPVVVNDMYEPQVRATTPADWVTIR
ncbi:MAG: alpha-2-macroglobulin family protein [Armatimonadota bacterium]